jgi:antitoxin PrlF
MPHGITEDDMNAVTVKGQVTIPKSVRDALGIVPGSQVEFVPNQDGEFVLRRARQMPEPHPFDRLLAILEPGPSTDEVMALTRGEG